MKKIILIILLSVFYFAGFAQEVNTEQNNQKEFSELKVYPNPCKTKKITVESNDSKITEINIVNIAGKQVLQKKFPSPENKKQLELTDVPDGIYLVRIKTDNDKLVVKKLIVSRE